MAPLARFQGKHWKRHVDERIRRRFEQFGDIVQSRILPVFDRINDEATGLEHRRLKELTSTLPDYDDQGAFEAAMADQAFNEAMDYAVTLSSMQFSTLGLYSAALYHMTEQHLIDLRQEILVDDGRDTVSRLAAIHWFRDAVGVDLTALGSWALVEELPLVANTVKHAEGTSAEALREVRPQLFSFPDLDDPYIGQARLRTPLFGHELFVTPDDFARYQKGTVAFWTELAEGLGRVAR